MYSKEIKEYAIECMKKGYKYVTFDKQYVVLWKNEPKYERVRIGSNDDRCVLNTYPMWVDMNSEEEDYFGTPDPDASILLSTLDSDWQRLFIKSLFEIAADGLTETLVKDIVDELTLNNIFEVKAVYGRICDIKHSDDSGQNRTYMLYANVTTDSEENGIVYCPKYSDANVSYLRMMCRDGDASFDITELVNYELSRRSSTDSTKYFTDNGIVYCPKYGDASFDITELVNYELSRRSSADSTKYFTDDELAWILDHGINMGADGIKDCDIMIEKIHTENPTSDTIIVTLYPSPLCPGISRSFELTQESRLFQKLDYCTHYYIQKDDLITRLSGKIFYTNKEDL